MLTAPATTETVKLRFDDAEISRATVSTKLDTDTAYVNNSLDFTAVADLGTIYLNIREHAYTSIEGFEAISIHGDLFTKTLTKVEAEALVAVLSNELAKL